MTADAHGNDSGTRRRRPGWSFFAKAAISLALLLVIVRSTGVRDPMTWYRALEPALLALAVATIVLQFALTAVRWQWVAAAYARPLSIPALLRIYLIAQFFSQVLPSTVGGDAVRVWLCTRRGVALRAALLGAVADRLIGAYALLACVAAALFLPLVDSLDPLARLSLLGVLAAAFAGALGALLVPGRWLARSRLTRLLRELRDGVATLRGAPARGAAMLGLSVLIHLLSVCVLGLLASCIGLHVAALTLALVVPVSLFIAMVPVSLGGWGVREGAMVLLLQQYGVAPDGALALSLLYGVALAAASLPGALAWLFSSGRGDMIGAAAALGSDT